jgi:hypothetical protein
MRLSICAPLLALAVLNGCGGSSTAPSKSFPHVEYRVDGTATQGSMTYSNATEGTEQVTANLPWSIAFTATKESEFVYISAQNQNSTGTVHVSILLDGVLFKEASSTGAFVIATASGSTP